MLTSWTTEIRHSMYTKKWRNSRMKSSGKCRGRNRHYDFATYRPAMQVFIRYLSIRRAFKSWWWSLYEQWFFMFLIIWYVLATLDTDVCMTASPWLLLALYCPWCIKYRLKLLGILQEVWKSLAPAIPQSNRCQWPSQIHCNELFENTTKNIKQESILQSYYQEGFKLQDWYLNQIW